MNTNNATGIGILDVVLIIFIILKLVGVITWPWWVVLIPLWASLILIVIIIIVFIICERRYK
jgi:hypothetical protein